MAVVEVVVGVVAVVEVAAVVEAVERAQDIGLDRRVRRSCKER